MKIRLLVQVPEIHISLMEDERIDHYLFYDLTLTTSCGMANIVLCVFLALDAGYSLNVHIIVFFPKSFHLLSSKMFCSKSETLFILPRCRSIL